MRSFSCALSQVGSIRVPGFEFRQGQGNPNDVMIPDALKMETLYSFEMLASTYGSSRRQKPED
jgi:hypothetical protein